jgi:hypothetical protein
MLTAQVIAFLLPETTVAEVAGANAHVQGTTALLRDAEGKITIEPVPKDSALVEQMLTTGCFRRGKAIVDPVSREIMGYEMEMVANLKDTYREPRAQAQFAL